MGKPLIVDGHLDISHNALNYNRDQLKQVQDIRIREREWMDSSVGTRWERGGGVNTVSLAEMQEANIFLGLATVNARIAHPTNDNKGYDGQEICHAVATGQLAYYEQLESQGQLRILRDWSGVREHLVEWQAHLQEEQSANASSGEGAQNPPVGIVLTMEGADAIVTPAQVDEWWSRGVRIVGLSHYGQSSYANGTGCEGGLTERGPALLEAMDEAGMILDLTHLADEAFWEAAEAFSGPIIATHCNCRSLVPGDRQLTDNQIQEIVDRDGVIGVAMDAWMLQQEWTLGIWNQVEATLETVVDHMDHICDVAGDAEHVAIGSDLDGGFGREESPRDLDTIADHHRITDILESRGYDEEEVAGIMHGNWLRVLETSL